jgi:peptide/nickel transport system permease protein
MLLRRPINLVAIAIILGWVAVAVLAGWLMPHDPTETVGRSRQPPSALFWFGTDQLGRDVFSRVLAGARISLPLGIVSVVLGALPGTVLGLTAGYFGGTVDTLISRLVDALLAFPGILLSLVVIAALGPGLRNVIIAVGVAMIPEYARLVRSSVLVIRELAYVEAARALGASNLRIMVKTILRNALGPILVMSTLQVGHAILVGAGLSYLGLGPAPPTPEWGLMSAEGQEFLRRAWWMSSFPGLAILSLVIALNLFGDGLKAVLDPRQATLRR